MSTNFDRDFSKGFVSAFPQSFTNAADGWQKMQELRRNIENDNFKKDNYLQQRRAESDKERRAAAARKTVVSLYKDRLRSSLADLDPEDQARYAKVLDETDDNVTPEVLNEHLTNIEKGISDAATRRKAKLEVEGLNNRKAGILKAAESQVARGRSAGDYDFILTLLEDGSPEAIKQAQAELKWKPEEPEKAGKKSLAEEKAELREDLLALGDDDMEVGYQRLKTADPQKYTRAKALGIKADPKDDPVKPYLDQIQRDFTVAVNKNEASSLKDFAINWMELRQEFIPEDVRNKILGKIYPERTSMWSPPAESAPTTQQPTPQPTPMSQPKPAQASESAMPQFSPHPAETPIGQTSMFQNMQNQPAASPATAPATTPAVAPAEAQVPEAQAQQAQAELKALMDELARLEAMFNQ